MVHVQCGGSSERVMSRIYKISTARRKVSLQSQELELNYTIATGMTLPVKEG